jgi:biopolymer transport protein TolQ
VQILVKWLVGLMLLGSLGALAPIALAQDNKKQDTASELDPDADPLAAEGETAMTATVDIGSSSIFLQAWRGGFVVFTVLVILVIFSVLSWALFIAKWLHLKKLTYASERFMKNFWESRSLNELNGRLGEYPYSPAKEVFRNGYAELVKGSQLRDQSSSVSLAVHAAIENLNRSLVKSKKMERKRMERYLPMLAIIASSSPFIGLFGTVWGIMNSFQEIARTGSASLAAVAPGISEALIATAFGLAAAIPAVIGYNSVSARIRLLISNLDGFSSDFLNIVERYLVTERKSTPTAGSPL